MQPQRISHYRLLWYPAKNLGDIVLVMPGLTTSSEVTLENLSAETFHTVADILRNERPVVWDGARGCLATLNEIVGEEEID